MIRRKAQLEARKIVTTQQEEETEESACSDAPWIRETCCTSELSNVRKQDILKCRRTYWSNMSAITFVFDRDSDTRRYILSYNAFTYSTSVKRRRVITKSITLGIIYIFALSHNTVHARPHNTVHARPPEALSTKTHLHVYPLLLSIFLRSERTHSEFSYYRNPSLLPPAWQQLQKLHILITIVHSICNFQACRISQ